MDQHRRTRWLSHESCKQRRDSPRTARWCFSLHSAATQNIPQFHWDTCHLLLRQQ